MHMADSSIGHEFAQKALILALLSREAFLNQGVCMLESSHTKMCRTGGRIQCSQHLLTGKKAQATGASKGREKPLNVPREIHGQFQFFPAN